MLVLLLMVWLMVMARLIGVKRLAVTMVVMSSCSARICISLK